MSAAADSRRPASLKPTRLGAVLEWLERAMANGRIPALLIAIISGLLLYGLLFTDDFRIETVVVEGLTYGDGVAVVESSGLLDASVARANPDSAAAGVADLPYVESVSVELQFPGNATIKVTERHPAINIEQNGSLLLVSAEGLTIASTSVDGLPVLRLDERSMETGTILSPDIVEAARAIAAVYGPDSALSWDPEFGLALGLDEDRLVVFGNPDEIDAKLRVLAAIEAQVEADWSQLDIRVPTRPSYR